MLIGEKIKKVRLDKKIELSFLASKLGVPLSFVNKIESNEIDPKFGTIERICEALEIDIAYLFNNKEKSKENIKRTVKIKKSTIHNTKNTTRVNDSESNIKDVHQSKELTKTEQLVKTFKDLYSKGYRFFDEANGDNLNYSFSIPNEDGSQKVYTLNGMKKAAELKRITFDGKILTPEDVEMIFNIISFVENIDTRILLQSENVKK